MPSAVELLRKQLREKFPGAHGGLVKSIAEESGKLSLSSFPAGAISEVVAAGSGIGLLLWEVFQQIRKEFEGCDIALIDCSDAFDPTSFMSSECGRLLWLRCSIPMEAIKAADLLLKDGNLPWVILDASSLRRKEMNGIADSSWWRLKLAIGSTSNRLLVLSQYPMVPCAAMRLSLAGSYSLADFDLPRSELAKRLHFNSERMKRVN